MKCLKNRDRQTKVDNTHALTTTIVMQCSLLQAELSPQRCRCRRRHTAWQRQSQAAAARAHDNSDKYVTTTTITTAIQRQCANFLLGDTMQQISNTRCKVPKSGEGQDQTIPGERTLAHSTQEDKDRKIPGERTLAHTTQEDKRQEDKDKTIPGERTLAHSTQEDRMVIGLDGTMTEQILASGEGCHHCGRCISSCTESM